MVRSLQDVLDVTIKFFGATAFGGSKAVEIDVIVDCCLAIYLEAKGLGDFLNQFGSCSSKRNKHAFKHRFLEEQSPSRNGCGFGGLRVREGVWGV